jgi:hypothetical protein
LSSSSKQYSQQYLLILCYHIFEQTQQQILNGKLV